MELTLEQLFGSGALQTSSQLIINKVSLLGLNPAANNTAESLLAAIVYRASENFRGFITDESEGFILDEENNRIDYDNRMLYQSSLVYFDRYYLALMQKIKDVFEYEVFAAE